MKKIIYAIFLFIGVSLSACTGKVVTVNAPIEATMTALPAATPSPIPYPTDVPASIPSVPSPVGFPYAAQLNDSLPKDNLLLARHFYGDPVGHIQGDEFCYDVGIYNDNTYIVLSCIPDFTYPAPIGTLDETQSRFLHRWVEIFQSFEEPSVQGLLKFNGIGLHLPEYSDQVSMQAMLGELEWNANAYVHRGGSPSAIFLAQSVLMHQLNIWLDNSSIRHFEAVSFPDSCLGAPKPNEICEQVPTQGFRIFLVAQGMMYEFRTDTFGYDIRQFGEPQIAPTQGPGG